MLVQSTNTHNTNSQKLCWVWPFCHSSRTGNHLVQLASLCQRISRGWRWLPACMLIGALPLETCYCLHWAGHHWLTGLLLFPVFLSLVYKDRTSAGMGAVAVCFLAHSMLAIYLANAHGQAAQQIFPGGLDYWQRTYVWIQTGYDPEYDPGNWVPAHFGLAGAMVLFSYCSMGLIPFIQGLYEVDLMNFYVGQLLTKSQEATIALGVGWHLWSILRGIGYTLLVYEVTAFSLEKFTGQRSSSSKWRQRRFLMGLAFLFMDGIAKFMLLDPVRQILFKNLIR